LWTTPSDLAKYMIETQLAYKGKSSKVLSQRMASLHLTPYIDNSATMGAFIGNRNGEKYFFHDAGNEGYRGLYYGSVEGGNGVVIFVNSDEGNIIMELLSSVAYVYNWPGFDNPVNVNTITVAESGTHKYTGVYLYEGKLAEITKEKDGLVYWANNQTCKIYFTSQYDFINIEFPTEKSFITDSSGNVSGFLRKLNGNVLPSAIKVTEIDKMMPLPGELNSFGWHLLESKRFADAIVFFKRGIELEPNENGIVNNLAHCYLFNNEYDKAIKLYHEFIDKTPSEQAAQKDIIKNDLAYFQKIGFDKIQIAKATADLAL